VSEDIGSAAGGFTVGSQIAGYRLEEQIGRGGMAVVFRAHDNRLDRMVALKILAPGLALDDAFRQRFIRESRAAAAVDDPHIIPVFEAGEARGVLFIAMRYVRGGDVRTLLDRVGPLPPARATEIISQVASALDAAHGHGLVHRDVKPANMLLDVSAGTDRPDHVYLSDFGLSKQALASSGITSTGQFLGTLDYVAPEQIEGRPVDGRADLYALACAAFELLSGAPPFKRDEGLAVVYAQLSEPPPSLSARRSGLAPAIDRVMTRAMAKSPADRYQSGREFAAAMREAFGLRSTDSGPESSPAPGRPATELAMPVAGGWTGSEPSRQDQPPPQHAPSPQPTSAPQPAPSVPPTSAAQPVLPPPWQQEQPAQPPPAAAGSAAGAAPGAGPPTQAAGVRAVGPTKPGLTEPPSGPAGGKAGPGYGGQPPARKRWRSRSALAAAVAVVLVVGVAAFYAALHSSGSGTGSGSGGNGTGNGVTTALTLPGCTTNIAAARKLTVHNKFVPLSGRPFGAAVTRDGRFSFVTLGDSIAVLKNDGGLAPKLFQTINVPGANKGMAFTPDGKYLIADADPGAVVINVAQAEQIGGSPVVGSLTSSPRGRGAVGVTTSPDGRFVFVDFQSSQNMGVFDLSKALAQGFSPADYIGSVPFGRQPVGLANSKDGRYLYVTGIAPGDSDNPGQGLLYVISLNRAEHHPGPAAIRVTTRAGCDPARVITSADGKVLWVTARQSDSLLGFSAAKLLSAHPEQALIAKVPVGANPIGLTLASGGDRIVVADSDYNTIPGGKNDLAVVDVHAALNHKPALLGYIGSGTTPRQFAVVPGGKTLLVTDNGAGEIQAIRIADLP
jgi:serine/threonine protein kinase/DNA-binding beta-propeller fold protein YncE